MKNILQDGADNYKKKQSRKKRWQKLVTILAAIAVFCTTYALILPAITLEKSLVCDIPEHHHTEECYQLTDGAETLVCTLEEHTHTDACFDALPAMVSGYVCGQSEHTHTEACYENGILQCTIPEHAHTEECEAGGTRDNVIGHTAVPANTAETEAPVDENSFRITAAAPGGMTVLLTGLKDALPYPAEELHLKVKAVNDERVDALIDAADFADYETVALDITLWRGVEEVQPCGDIQLSFIGVEGADRDNAQVLHIEPDTQTVEEMAASSEEGTVTLGTNHFSIYVVSVPVHTFEFYDGEDLVARQIVKSGEELLRPATPQRRNYKFLGWSGSSEGGAPYFTSFGEQTVTETETTTLYADMSQIYYVFFMQPADEEELPEATTETGTGYKVMATKEGITGTVVTTGDIYFKADDGHELVGWSLTELQQENVESVTLEDENITLYPIIEEGYWITYETQTTDSYIKPAYYSSSQRTAAPAEPTRAGYSFQYWCTDPEHPAESRFTFGSTLSSAVTLYAVWNPVQVNYTVIHWIENANYYDDDDAADGIMPPDVIDPEEYSFWCAETKRGTSGTNTNAAAFSNAAKAVAPTVFNTGHWTAQPITQVEIDGHGNTIVNVYYKRTVFTIDFKIGLETFREPYNNPYADGIKSGYAIPLTNGKNLQIVAKWGATVSNLWPDRRTETVRNFTVHKSNSSSTPRLATYHLMLNGNAKSYSGTVSEAFPVGSAWQVNDGSEWYEEYGNIHYGWFNSAIAAMPDWNDTYYYRDVNETDNPKYAQLVTNVCVDPLPDWPSDQIDTTIDGQGYVIYDTTFFNTGHRDWWTVEPDPVEGFTFKEGSLPTGLATFRVDNDNRSYVNKGYIGNPYEETIGGKKFLIETTNYVYSRNQYDIHFISEGAEINTIKDVYYEQDISSISYTPTREGYIFEGWYSNNALAGEEFSFAGLTMPAKDITLYAKWTPKTVKVRFFSDLAENDPEEIAEQTRSIGDTVDTERVPEVYREDSRFICWMIQDESGEYTQFHMNTYLDKDIDLYPYFADNDKYVVTYDLNKSMADEIAGKTLSYLGQPPVDPHAGGYAYGSYAEVELLPMSVSVPEELIFLHWSTTPDDSGTDYNPEEKIFMEENCTLYAIWGPNPSYDKTFLTYHSNFGEGTTEETHVTDSVAINEQITVLDNMFSYPGHKFVGWNEKPDGTGTWWAVGTDARLDGPGSENNLYAIWESAGGPVLPETGGIGLYVIYSLGALLVLGSVTCMCILRRRSEKETK